MPRAVWCHVVQNLASKAYCQSKGFILKGIFPNEELCLIENDLKSIVLPQDQVEFKVRECSIFYFDYGICALEHVFEFNPLTRSSEPTWLDSPFWADFKKKVMAAVEGRELGVLKEERWPYMQKILVDAFDGAVDNLKLPNQSGMVDFHTLYGVAPDHRGHFCASFGINFILFGYFGDQLLGAPSEPLNRTVRRIIGRPISQADGQHDQTT